MYWLARLLVSSLIIYYLKLGDSTTYASILYSELRYRPHVYTNGDVFRKSSCVAQKGKSKHGGREEYA